MYICISKYLIAIQQVCKNLKHVDLINACHKYRLGSLYKMSTSIYSYTGLHNPIQWGVMYRSMPPPLAELLTFL